MVILVVILQKLIGIMLDVEVKQKYLIELISDAEVVIMTHIWVIVLLVALLMRENFEAQLGLLFEGL
jgi:hypothetical protein